MARWFGAGHEVVGDVVLAGQPAVGAVADERIVQVHRMHALGTADVQHHLVPLPPAPVVNVRRYTPVGLRSGSAGGGPGNGICTLV